MTTTKNAMNFGAMLGLSLCAVSGITMTLGYSQSNLSQWISYAVVIVFIILGTKSFRDKFCNGFISYGNALKSGVLISFFGAIIVAFFIYLYISFVDSSIIEKSLEIAEQRMMEKEMSDQQIEMGLKYSRMFMTPSVMAVFVVLGNTFMGLIFSLITSAFLKKENTDFNQFIENNN